MNERTIIGAGGELSDFQYILQLLDELRSEDYCADDGSELDPREIFSYLGRVLYNRRSKCACAPSILSVRVGALADMATLPLL